MEKGIWINGVDSSTLFQRYGYEVNYAKVCGNAAGTMMDGSEEEDVIAIKAVITLNFMPLTDAQYNEFLDSLFTWRYATVKYFEPRNNDYRETKFIYSEPGAKHSFRNINNDDLWDAKTITFREMGAMDVSFAV